MLKKFAHNVFAKFTSMYAEAACCECHVAALLLKKESCGFRAMGHGGVMSICHCALQCSASVSVCHVLACQVISIFCL